MASDNNNSSDLQAMKSIFRLSLDLRNFEISQLAQRNNFFMIFQGVLLAGVVQSAGGIPVVSFLVCIAGLSVSLLQVGMAAGAKYWQERWESAVEKSEKLLLSHLADDNVDRNLLVHMFPDNMVPVHEEITTRINSTTGHSFVNKLISKRFSVSRIPIYVGLCLSFVWFLLLLCTLRGYPPLAIPSFIVGFTKI